MIAPETRANILIEALPYIKEYNGEVIVVKYGGNAMIDEELKQAVIQDIMLLHLVGIHVVLVHGGGPDISRMLKKTGAQSRFINGLRYTDDEAMEIVQMVLCGKVNKDLVRLLEGKGIGLGGMDGGLFRAVKMTDPEGTDYGFVGDIVDVNPKIVQDVIDQGYIPVISSVAAGRSRGQQCIQCERGYGCGENRDRTEGEEADPADGCPRCDAGTGKR